MQKGQPRGSGRGNRTAHVGANSRRRNSALTPYRLLLIALGLLLIAYFVGGRATDSAHDGSTRSADDDTARGRTSARTRPSMIEGKKSTTLASIDDARMSVSQDGRVLRIEGSVGRNFATDLRRSLESNPALQRIDITSNGGYASSGLEAARWIRKRNLIVRVRSHCASICVAVWSAAAQRQMEADAVIGLHQWNPQCEALPPPQRKQCRYQAQFATEHATRYDSWLRGAGFNQQLLALAKNTAAEDLAVLDVLQLWDNGVDFSVITADGRRIHRHDVADYLARTQRSRQRD